MLTISLGGVGRLLNVGLWEVCVGWNLLIDSMTGGATYLMLWPADGKMHKEDIRATFDGSIFYVIAERRAKATPTTQ